MYTLQKENKKKGVKEYFCEDSSSKERNSVNLFSSQWRELDRFKSEFGISRSKLLRMVLSEVDMSDIAEKEGGLRD